MIIIHCMLKKEYETIKNKSLYGKEQIEKDGLIHFSTWNSFYYVAPHFMKDDEPKVFLCVDTGKLEAELRWEDGDGTGREYPHLYGLLNMNSVVDVVPFLYEQQVWQRNNCTHILMNTSCVDENWCFPTIANYIKSDDKVCVVAFSFWKDTKTNQDWNKQYHKRDGIWYAANTDVWKRYGIQEENVVWINYFEDSKASALNKIINCSVVFFTGGAPDLMMQRIQEFELCEVLERYQGVMVGYSAGAMVQIKDYHISPDLDYPMFSYEKGLDMIQDFDIEVHYKDSKIQNDCIKKVGKEKNKDIYAIYEDGGLVIHKEDIQVFGRVKVNRVDRN